MLGNWTEAKEDLDRALTLAPSMAIARQLRAEAHLNLDQLNLAMADIDAAMAVDPENIDTLVLRGRVREAIRLSKVRVLSPEIVD
jgi:Tfp pilus assembly protein PilF